MAHCAVKKEAEMPTKLEEYLSQRSAETYVKVINAIPRCGFCEGWAVLAARELAVRQ
jgi:hypothetical protein